MHPDPFRNSTQLSLQIPAVAVQFLPDEQHEPEYLSLSEYFWQESQFRYHL